MENEHKNLSLLVRGGFFVFYFAFSLIMSNFVPQTNNYRHNE